MQRLSSFSHAWTHVVQYRAQSLLPCPFYHKSQSSEASNHKSTDEATIISLFADSASPSSSSRNHLTALVLLVVLVKDFLDANKAVVSACRRHLRTTYRGLPQWCSPSNALRQTTKKKKKNRRRHRNGKGIQIQLLNGVLRRTHFAKPQKKISSTSPQWGRKSNIVTTSIFLYTRPVYQNYNLQRATNTNRGKIDGVSNQGH